MLRRLRRPRSRVFTVRRWQPQPAFARSANAPGSPRLGFDVLWYSVPPKYVRVEVDEPFDTSDDYPVSGNGVLPLLDVHTRQGQPYLSIGLCPKTGAVFHRRLPPPSWQADYYRTAWDTGRQAALPSPEDLLRQRINKVARILGPRVRAGLRVLDVGCGYGDQLFYLKQRGCDVFGVEPSRHRAEYARDRFGISVLSCPIDGQEFQGHLGGRRFDLVYLNQVLEHLNDPLTTLRILRPVLADDGVLLVGVPDLFRDSLTTYCASIVHTHSFSAGALTNFAALAGYHPIEDLSFPGYLYVLFGAGRRDGSLVDAGTGRVVEYLAAHFAARRGSLKKGSIISVSSSYTGETELGLRVTSAPDDDWWNRFDRASRAADIGQLRTMLPFVLTMPVDRPTLWQK